MNSGHILIKVFVSQFILNCSQMCLAFLYALMYGLRSSLLEEIPPDPFLAIFAILILKDNALLLRIFISLITFLFVTKSIISINGCVMRNGYDIVNEKSCRELTNP